MAVQFNCEELSGCKDYLFWMQEKVCSDFATRDDERNKGLKNLKRSSEIGCEGGNLNRKTGDFTGKDHTAEYGKNAGENLRNTGENRKGSSILGEVTKEMFSTDFICWDEAIKDDEIRVTDAMELRRIYADEAGALAGKSEREIDRIWKSIHGKCSVLELVLSICYRLDEMVNEDEPGTMVGLFFRIFVHNMELDETDEKADPEEEKNDRKAKIERFIQRSYNPDGSGGGLFPLKNWSAERGDKDQRKVPIWLQMNTWLNEHLDEEEHFVE